jgi:hypothetical protein
LKVIAKGVYESLPTDIINKFVVTEAKSWS